MSEKPLVSIIILNYNGSEFIEEVLTSVDRCGYPDMEIIVVDNASSDNSPEIVKSNFPGVKVIENKENLGFAEGNNVGIRKANGKYICLVNNDLKVTHGWLDKLVDFLESHPEYGAVQPKILSWREPEMFEYAGASGGFIDKYGITFMRGRILEKVEQDTGQYDESVDIFWASGAAICFRRTIIDEIGELDKNFFLHQEEIDFCWRMILAGYKLAVIPESVVYHYGGASLNYGSPNKLFLNYRNNLTMMFKNMPGKKLAKIFPGRIFLDMGAVFYKLLHGHFGHGWAIIKGYGAAFSNIPHIREQRKKNLANRKGDNYFKHTVYDGSIVIDYFLKGNKLFANLSFPVKKIKK